MVSDTPSSKDNNKKHETTEDASSAKPATSDPASLQPKSDDTAVESAMADVAAAIKHHEDHRDETDSEQQADGSETDTGAKPADDGTTPPPPSEPAATSAEPAKGSGLGTMLAGGVAGAVIALAGAYGLYSAGLLGNADESKVNDEIASLRQEVEALKANDGSTKLQSQLDALKTQVDSADGSRADIAALKQQIGTLQSSVQSDDAALKTLQTGFNQLKSGLTASQQTMEQKLSALEAKVNTPGKDLAVARAIAAAALKSAIDRGQGFVSELSTYSQVAPDSTDIAKLKSLAEKGIPTREELISTFSAKADAIIAATEPPPPEGNIFNRLVDSAKGLVSVRPVGDATGNSVPAIVARIENELTKGNLKTAEAEWETLPEAAKQASAKFANALKARIEADRLVSQSLNTALGATVGAPVPAASSSGN